MSQKLPLIDVVSAGSPENGWPVTLGVPFTPGQLSETTFIGLLSPTGYVDAVSACPLINWPDGSVRWALLAFKAKLTGEHQVVLNSGGKGQGNNQSEQPARIHETAAGVTLNDGFLQARLSREGSAPISELLVNGTNLLENAGG